MISFCISTYGYSKELKLTTESIFKEIEKQNIKNAEIIIVNGKDKNIKPHISSKIIKLYNIPDKNLYTGMNNCINFAKNEYVWFINSGDVLIQNSLTSIKNCLTESNYDLIFLNVLYPNNVIGKFKRKDMVFSHQGVIYRKFLHDKFGFYIDSFNMTASDFNFFYLISKSIDFNYVYHNKTCVKMSPNGLSSSLSHYIQRDFFIFLNDKENVIKFIFRIAYTSFRYYIGFIKRYFE